MIFILRPIINSHMNAVHVHISIIQYMTHTHLQEDSHNTV